MSGDGNLAGFDLASVMLRPMAARHLAPGVKLLDYLYSPEDGTLVPVVVTVTKVKRMFRWGPVLGYSFTSPGGSGGVSGGIDAVIVVQEIQGRTAP